MSNNRIIAVILSFLMILAAVGCSAGNNSTESNPPTSAEQPPSGSNDPNPLEEQESEAENPPQGHTPLGDFADELRSVRSGELVSKVNQLLDQHRNGTFEEMPNHHPAYPADFPPVTELPVIDHVDDLIIAWIEPAVIDANTERVGIIFVIVSIDQSHIYVLEPALFSDADNNLTLGFGGSGFHSFSAEELLSQSEDWAWFGGESPMEP